MKFLNFSEFLNESLGKGDMTNYSNSPFLRFPELLTKKKTASKNAGELNSCGEMVHFIYFNQGHSAKELKNLILGHPINKPESETYTIGGHRLEKPLKDALNTPYVKRTNTRPSRYYADVDPNMTIEQIIHKNRGSIQGKKYGI